MKEVLISIGLFLSIYTAFVQWNLRRTAYVPLCEINKNISCVKAFQSNYSHILGISNSYVGIFYYLLLFVADEYYLILASLGVIASLILAYISYIKQKNFCIVCSSIYIINIALFIFAFT